MSGGAKLEILGAAAPSNAPLGFAGSTGGGGIPSIGGSGSPSVGGGGIAAGSEGGKGKGGRSAGFGRRSEYRVGAKAGHGNGEAEVRRVESEASMGRILGNKGRWRVADRWRDRCVPRQNI